jgi:anti-sigma B factor antagonist
VPAMGYLFQMAGGVPVVTAPAEIDDSTAGGLRAILVEWHARGHTTMVVDLTATRFCDSAGLRELVRAHRRAVAGGGGLRLVIPAYGALLRVFGVTGLDGMIPHFATVTQALAHVPASASRPRHRESSAEPASAPGGSPGGSPGRVREHRSGAADSRGCARCGALLVQQGEHAGFCGGDCRVAWNREHLGDPAVDASSLTSSMAAMSEATARLPAVKVWDHPQAFAAIGEAVWWITMVDATLVRHHPGAYDTVMAARGLAERELIVEGLAGLLFVRNWIGRGAELGEAIDTGAGTRRITQWTWKPIGEPALAGLRPRARAWELARYRAYQACVAGHTIGKTFGQAVAFLTPIGANATSSTGTTKFQKSAPLPEITCGSSVPCPPTRV